MPAHPEQPNAQLSVDNSATPEAPQQDASAKNEQKQELTDIA